MDKITETEASRDTVIRFCECLSQRDFAGMAEFMTSDATWWVIGRTDYAPYGGLHGASDIMKTIQEFFGPIDEFRFTVEATIAEGNRVAIEATSAGKNGAATYKNVYTKIFKLRDGKIESIREFFDAYELTAYLKQLGVSSDDAFVAIDNDE